MDKALTRGSRFLALGGLAAIAFGAVVLIWPGISLLALIALFGAFALVYGTFALATGLNQVAHRRTDWVPYLLAGLAGIAIGAVTFFAPGVTTLVLLYLIAGWAIITGVFELVAAVDMQGEVQGAWLYGLSGVLSIVFGALVAIRPGAGALAILWLIGIYAIIAGVIRLVFAYRLHSAQSALHGVVQRAEGAS